MEPFVVLSTVFSPPPPPPHLGACDFYFRLITSSMCGALRSDGSTKDVRVPHISELTFHFLTNRLNAYLSVLHQRQDISIPFKRGHSVILFCIIS